jgi:hypothetical protein
MGRTGLRVGGRPRNLNNLRRRDNILPTARMRDHSRPWLPRKGANYFRPNGSAKRPHLRLFVSLACSDLGGARSRKKVGLALSFVRQVRTQDSFILCHATRLLAKR